MMTEIELDAELYRRFKALCTERELDIEEELTRCLQEYIAGVRAEVED